MSGTSPPSLARRLAAPANLLSLVRIPLGAVVWLHPESPSFVLTLLIVAAVTDMLDGVVARALAKRRGEPLANAGDIGAWLDPLCDKLFVVSATLAILLTHRPPVWVVATLLSRDLLSALTLLAFSLRYGRAGLKRVDFRAVYAGKATTVLQFVCVLSVLYWPAATAALAIASGATGVVAIVQVSRRALASVR